MKQIKIFYVHGDHTRGHVKTCKGLERQVNAWLMENSNVQILHSQLSMWQFDEFCHLGNIARFSSPVMVITYEVAHAPVRKEKS